MNDKFGFETDASGGEAPLSNRVTRGTLLGCLGILCVLILPLLLALPVDLWSLPRWMALLVPLVGCVAVTGGAALLAHVPSTAIPRSGDPRHPLTKSGMAPLVERPADWRNRAMLLAVGVLMLACLVGYAIASFAMPSQAALLDGTVTVTIAGALLALLSLLVGFRVVPLPAARWTRMPISGQPGRASFVMAVGLVALGWALLSAAFLGFLYGKIGIGVLLLGAVFVAPLMRRLPARPVARRTHPSWPNGSTVSHNQEGE